ncbi:hypothetical protein AYI69_g11586 [Smittium culicis]|uniref:Uncharacterized protein n=1 Tax=Smittium culicis TaxID=133412 RepID=A0A1R1WXC5_9FUNG|nr:hypothetical protein AYI69_g11586 [Smittium culicis]
MGATLGTSGGVLLFCDEVLKSSGRNPIFLPIIGKNIDQVFTGLGYPKKDISITDIQKDFIEIEKKINLLLSNKSLEISDLEDINSSQSRILNMIAESKKD